MRRLSDKQAAQLAAYILEGRVKRTDDHKLQHKVRFWVYRRMMTGGGWGVPDRGRVMRLEDGAPVGWVLYQFALDSHGALRLAKETEGWEL